MDSLFDNLIFLIPVAIFIGRIVTAAKNKEKDKKKPAPKWPDTRPARPQQQLKRPSEPEISIHFEDDSDDESPESVPLPRPARIPPGMPARAAMIPPLVPMSAAKTQYAAFDSTVFGGAADTPAVSDFTRAPAKSQGTRAQAAKSGEAAEQASFPLNLNKLSPLKQAVVMAEVLGPPKGLL